MPHDAIVNSRNATRTGGRGTSTNEMAAGIYREMFRGITIAGRRRLPCPIIVKNIHRRAPARDNSRYPARAADDFDTMTVRPAVDRHINRGGVFGGVGMSSAAQGACIFIAIGKYHD